METFEKECNTQKRYLRKSKQKSQQILENIPSIDVI